MTKMTTQQITNIIAVTIMIVMNGLANSIPLNGQQTGEISDRFQVYFVPAGYVFSIWGVIYLGLVLFTVYQAMPGQRANPRLARTDYLVALSCLANIAWLILWHYNLFVLTLLAMFSLLGLLIVIYLRLEIGQSKVPPGERWLVHLPFSVYLGWVTVATIANVTSTLDYLGWSDSLGGIGAASWAAVMLVVGAAVALAMGLTRRDVAYILVLVWAYTGIAYKHASTPLVATAAWAMSGILVLLIGYLIIRPAIRRG